MQGNSRKAFTSVSLIMLKPLTLWITTNWKILQEMGISDHLTCLLRNLYASQEATVRTGHRTVDWFKIGRGVLQGCILSSYLFNLHTEYIMWNTRLDEAQAGIKRQWRAGKPGMLQSVGLQRVRHNCVWTRTTGRQGQIISLWTKQRHFSLTVRQRGQSPLRQASMYDYSNNSNKNQVKERVPTWSQNWFFPAI